MYKLLNHVFGWGYIHWHNYVDQGIARVCRTPDGKVYYWRYRITDVLDVIIESEQVAWLTCKSTKYIGRE